MRRRILALAVGVLAALSLAPAASASEFAECHRFGAEWKLCYWLLEPNPSGGNVFQVTICEGATCIEV